MSGFAFDGTRRQFLAESVVLGTAATALAALGPAATAIADTSAGADTSVHQEVDFKAGPDRIYEAFLEEKQFSSFSGAPAQIQREAGGAFKYFGGLVTGRIVELMPNQRIVLAWHPEAWPSGIYSVVRLQLTAPGSGTRIVLDQTGIPPERRQAQIDNWSKHVWGQLRNYLDV